MRRGDIVLANLNPARGTEPGKARPVLIVQSQVLLDVAHPSTLIVPLTTRLVDDAEPLRVRVRAVGRLERDSDLLIDQLRAIDNRRLIDDVLHHCDAGLIGKVEDCMRDVLGITVG